jgi:carboxylesterase
MNDDPNGPSVLPGAEPWSHAAPPGGDALPPGFLALHGFTGNPSSMRLFAESMAGAGFHVELPRLPGHGTTVDEMMTTTWDDWTAEAEAAYARLAGRTDRIVVGGLSMGAALTLWIGSRHPEVAGLVCVNPACQPQGDEVRELLEATLAAGTDVMPGIGSDIADPDAHEIAYDGTPVRPLLSLLDGVTTLAERYGELRMPMLVVTSKQDHVVDPAQSDYLAAEYGGEIDRRWLERSYHVATLDFDRDVIFAAAIEFARRVTGG